MLESKCHSKNSFVTLTYGPDNLPLHGSLNYRDVQLFLKRTRRALGPFRFFVCGEYGDSFDRPHYHALLFGLEFPDRIKCNSVYSSDDVYRSPTLERLWPHGFSTIGAVSYASARYCAAYVVKRVNGSRAEDHYSRVVAETGEIVSILPEFARMSLRPGIGFPWLQKYWRDLYSTGHDAVIVDGARKRIPRYFDTKMDELVPLLMDDIEYQRFVRSQEYACDQTPERLAVREQVELARIAFDQEKKVPCRSTRLLP